MIFWLATMVLLIVIIMTTIQMKKLNNFMVLDCSNFFTEPLYNVTRLQLCDLTKTFEVYIVLEL